MPTDPLFFDLRLALENARPIQELLSDHLREEGEETSSLTPAQRVLVDAGLARMIQSVYSAAENLLLKTAAPIDGGVPPKDDNWHAALLARMAHDFPGRRPAVLSRKSVEVLSKLRGFRHVARNTYAHELDHDRLISNAELAVQVLPLLSDDVDALERHMTSDGDPIPHPTPGESP